MSSRAAHIALRRRGRLTLAMAAGVVLLVANVLPLAWGVVTSLKPGAQILHYPPTLLFRPTLAHYLRVLQEGFGHNLLVSLLDQLAAEAQTLLVAVPAAYAFARGSFPLRRPLYLLVVACIPLSLGASALIIPAYIWFMRLGLNDTVVVLPLIYAGYQIPMASWILRSDVGDEDGLTKVVPLSVGQSVPYWPVPGHHDITNYLPAGMFAEEEVSMTGPAGTLFAFRTDVLHRGSRMTGERSTRFALLTDYDVWGPRWTGKVAWAARATQPDWFEIVERASPRERSVFGWPAPGDPYWDEQTLADTQARYPRANLTPYR